VPENSVVRARIDEHTKHEAAAVLDKIGLTLSDAFRLLLKRVVAEKKLPFEPLDSNADTIEAMQAARGGRNAQGACQKLQRRQGDDFEAIMSDIDLESLMPVYAYEFQVMIGDIQDYLELSESTIEWQYRTERQRIRRQAERGDFRGFPSEYSQSYGKHLENNADHRFKVSLPLRIRYGALIALVTMVEWSVNYLARAVGQELKGTKEKSKTVWGLEYLAKRCGLECDEFIKDFQVLSYVRNCIAHNAGLEEGSRYRTQLREAIARLEGVSFAKWHFLGSHVAIEKGALDKYIENMKTLVVDLHKKAYEQELFTSDT